MTGDELEDMAKLKAALRSARGVISDERLEQMGCYTLGGKTSERPDKALYATMDPGERTTIRRLDRVIAKIDAALTDTPD